MRVLFCHDGPLMRDRYHNYYGVAHNDETFKRYYLIGDELSVIMRVSDIHDNASARLSRITVSPFRVVACPNMYSLKGLLIDRHKAKTIIRQEVANSDYVVARLPSQIGILAIDMATKLDKPYLVELVGCPWDALWHHSLKGKLMAPFMYVATKRRVWTSRFTVYVTSEFLQERYPTQGRSESCSNVALAEFDEGVLERRLRRISRDRLASRIALGTIAPVNVRYKGQQYVIQALGELKRQGIANYEYQLVGGGDQTYLRDVAQKNGVIDQVKFLGAVPYSEVFRWLETIDLYVQPSLAEGLPRALIEAMSKGLPAFGANTGGIPELLDREFVFSNTTRRTAEICSILMSFDRNTMLAQARRNYAKSKEYSKEIIDERRREFFKEFTESSL